MSLFYKFQYLIGLTPWERMPSLPIGQQAMALLDREESGREKPYGRALDLGCGTGYWSLQLARRGWEVTGIDIVPKALRAARARARKAEVEVKFLEGSITDLAAAAIGPGFGFFLDFGVVHGLSTEQVRRVAREVTAVAHNDASLLMYAFSPGHRGPLPRGIDRDEIEQAYGEWTITEEIPFDVAQAPSFVQKAQPRFYHLRRR